MNLKSLVLSGAAIALAIGLVASAPAATAVVHTAPVSKSTHAPAAQIDPTPTAEQAAAAAPEGYYDQMRGFAPLAGQSDINLDFLSHAICGGLAALGYADYSADVQRMPLTKFQTLQLMSLVIPQFCPNEESAVTG
jgi:hypothetical protein